MRKLKLNPEQLAVESFQTATPAGRAGTVRGAAFGADHEIAEPGVIAPAPVSIWTCETGCGQNTCGGTCGVTCATCDDPTCNSCYATGCWTGMSPECCA
jgi:hypothetical protein